MQFSISTFWVQIHEKAFLYLGLDGPEVMPSANRELKAAKHGRVACLTSNINHIQNLKLMFSSLVLSIG